MTPLDLRGVEVVSWDLDGTLYELPPMVAALRRRALLGALRHPLRVPREIGRVLALRRAYDAVRQAGGDLSRLVYDDLEATVALQQRWFGEAIAAAGPRGGVLGVIDALAARGLRQVVITDHRAGYKLRALGLLDAFERVYCAEDVGWLKPSPRIFEAALGDLDVAPAALLHVGDRPDTDLVAAQAAGCRCAIVAPGPLPAGWVGSDQP